MCKWRWEREVVKTKKGKKEVAKSVPYFDGPDMKVLNNRDCLPNPSYSTVKNWFQYRDYLTLDELRGVNDAARGKPIYKNLDLLNDALKQEQHNTTNLRSANYQIPNKSLKGLQDYLGRDEVYKVVEIVTEYRRDRWITFAPKQGVVLRDIPNPYKHQQIPIVMLRYYEIDDDLYGLSEIEPVKSEQRAINALVNQYLDGINMSLYTPLKIRATGVQMHTLEFGPGAKWIMNDPATDVMPHQATPKGISEFGSTYRFLVGAMQEGLGETSAATSNLDPLSPEKTATEIKDLSIQRQARDNFNQIYLSGAIKKQMMFWHTMNRQFLFSDPREQEKVIRIVGRDAIRYFQGRGLDEFQVPDQTIDTLTTPEGLDLLDEGEVIPSEFRQPKFPVDLGDETIPKFAVEEGGEVGHLIITPEDLSGTYDFIPDIESMQLPDDAQVAASKRQLLEFAKDPATLQILQQEGVRIKMRDLLEDFFEDVGLKDASKYFEGAENVQTDQAGAGVPQPGQAGQGVPGAPGVAAGPQAVAGGQAQPVLPGPGQI